MFKRELFSICAFYAISPIHAGSGASMAAVDLPIQRERHTNWPHIQSSGVKGAMRAHFRDFTAEQDKQLINFIFGSDEQDGWSRDKDNIAGAVSFSDAKLLAFPMRSNVAPFVWITCPSVLKRLNNDLEFTKLPAIDHHRYHVTGESALCLAGAISGNVILEDMVVAVANDMQNPIPREFPQMNKLLLISDDVFKYAVESCTEIQTQIKIDSGTGTAQEGALRYQELLPADTVMYSIVYYSRTHFDNELQAKMVQEFLEKTIKDHIQIGGDETLGRGICKINWIQGGAR
jgi:CRISPR-associated protein Cmr4